MIRYIWFKVYWKLLYSSCQILIAVLRDATMNDEDAPQEIGPLLESLGLSLTAKFRVLQFFLKQPLKKEFFLSEIATATGLTVTSVKNAVEDLLEEDRLGRVERGGMKFYQMPNSTSVGTTIQKAIEEFRKIAQQ